MGLFAADAVVVAVKSVLVWPHHGDATDVIGTIPTTTGTVHI